MYNKVDEHMLKRISNTLMEFGSGNLYVKLRKSGNPELNDDIKALASNVNSTLEKVRPFFHHRGFANQTEQYHYSVQAFFILDSADSIVAGNPAVKKILAFDDNTVAGKPFNSFLTEKSKLDWYHLKTRWEQQDRAVHNDYITLSLKTKQDAIMIMHCLVDKIFGKKPFEGILVTSVEAEKDSEKKKRELFIKITARKNKSVINHDDTNGKYKKNKITLKSSDIKRINKVHEYIQDNLKDPLPSLKELAKSFDSKAFRLKHGFRLIYGQTPYSFFISERLNKANQLVKTSNLPLNQIAIMTGFKHTSHFTMAFKKAYNHTPRDIRKQCNIEQNREGV